MRVCWMVTMLVLWAGVSAWADAAEDKKPDVSPEAKTPASRDAPTGEAKDQPADEKATPKRLKPVVESVSGRAQKLLPGEGNKWIPLKVGDVLDEMTVIRTGYNTAVVLKFADRGSVTIKGVTKIGISEFRKEGDLVKTRLGLKYGMFRAKVKSEVGPNDFRVKTPTATLSVRGSEPMGGWTVDGGPRGHSLSGPLTMMMGSGLTQFTQTVHMGNTVTGSGQLPILLLQNTFSAHLGVSFGATRPEQRVFLQNPGGRIATGGFVPSNNAGSGGGIVKATTPVITRPLVPPRDLNPGYP
ncbi:MAG TPA: FecR domain-containing protein [Phycisphaerae bacterium]|nr:FecR domain-containing protein [Phycisphaerae bacterium]